jgi:hypothetical protein
MRSGSMRLTRTPGAGGSYVWCGFTEVGWITYRKVPLIHYQLLLTQSREFTLVTGNR